MLPDTIATIKRNTMTLSVLIPTHNYKCYTLVSQLHDQLEVLNVDYEILVAEDGSKDQVSIISNHRINELSHCHHIIRKENVGRAAIRNFLAETSKGDWLFFMDSDGRVISDDFVRKYIEAATDDTDLVEGGWTHPEKCPAPNKSLRWKYEKAFENEVRLEDSKFRSFCFMIRREMFASVPFQEKYRRYGWEDCRFGKDLRESGCRFSFINNPLMNVDIEQNEVFLAKTEEAMQSLFMFKDELKGEVRLLNIVDMLRRKHLTWIFKLLYVIFRTFMRRNLVGKSPNLKIFAAYKLGYYLSL